MYKLLTIINDKIASDFVGNQLKRDFLAAKGGYLNLMVQVSDLFESILI